MRRSDWMLAWIVGSEVMARQFTRLDVDAQITAYSNLDRYTKDNLRVDSQGHVVYPTLGSCQ